MRVKVYTEDGADIITVPASMDLLDVIYDLYGRYLDYTIL
jgi:hypothetical protein